MTSLIRSLQRADSKRSHPVLSLEDWASFFSLDNLGLGRPFGIQQTLGQPAQEISGDFPGLIEGVYKSNGIVFACMLARMLLFSEARFQFRQIRNGRPGDLFGNADLALLENPWPNATTGDLLARAIQDVDLAGNFFAVKTVDRIYRMRPDWVTIMVGSKTESDYPGLAFDAEIIGYTYHPGGRNSGSKTRGFTPDQVAHFAPIPDPSFRFRGMSWLTPILRDIMGDQAITTHKLKYFENAASPNMVVSLDPAIQRETFEKWIDSFESQHKGVLNAYKTLYLGAGAKVEVIGSNMKEADLGAVQAESEVRIAAAAGVPPVIAGLSRGLDSSTYSNYAQARRRFADGTMRPLWRNIAGSLATLVNVPAGAELWYDARDIPFLAEDIKDAAQVQQTQSIAIKTLIDAGFDPPSVIDAVNSGDFSRLNHSGLVSVQLQPPGESLNGGSPNGIAPALSAGA